MSFLDPEALIVARLQERIELTDWADKRPPRVFTAADSAGVEERSQLAPAYFVVLDYYGPTQEQGAGRVQQMSQQWVVYGVVRSAARHDSAQGVRDDAKLMFDLVTAALCGWPPSVEFSPFRMLAESGPVYSDAGFGYFPLRFETRCVVRGA